MILLYDKIMSNIAIFYHNFETVHGIPYDSDTAIFDMILLHSKIMNFL